MRGVFVVGMHRSGTSAATRLITLLGVPTCVDDDLMPGTVENPKGFWESRSLTAFNDRILAHLGCDWSCPPVLAPRWHREAAIAELAAPARDLFAAVMPTEAWVWKDPRLCVTLPFWLDSLDVEPTVFLVLRNPLEIAASLAGRDGHGKPYALALWERHLRLALAALAGLPVLVADYAALLADPVAWSREAARDLTAQWLPVRDVSEPEVLAFAQASLRSTSSTEDEFLADTAVSDAQRELFVALAGVVGSHERFTPPCLGLETATTEALLAEGRRFYRVEGWYRARCAELEARLESAQGELEQVRALLRRSPKSAPPGA